MYWIKRKIWQINNVVKWLPIIWNQYDFDYHDVLEVFKFQLQKTSNYLNSDKAHTLCAKDTHKRIEMILRLMNKVYDDDYGMEYIYKLRVMYGEEHFKHMFIPYENKEDSYELKDSYEIKDSYELTEKPERVKEISEMKNKLMIESYKKQKRAHKLLWDLVEHNIQKFWS